MKLYPFYLTSASRATTLVVLFVMSLLALVSPIANAKPPILEKPNGSSTPGQALTGTPLQFDITYLQDSGDKPRSPTLVIESPTGGPPIRLPATTVTSGDPATEPLTLTWYFTPLQTGTFKYHFETSWATASPTEIVRFPNSSSDDDTFQVYSLVSKYVILFIGVVVAMGFLPFLVYIAVRSMNKKSDPGTAARVAIIVGALAAYSLYIYLFNWVYSPIMNVIVAVALIAVLTVLFTRRR